MNDISKERLQLRIPADLKNRVRDHAEQLGIPINTAVILLLNEALHTTAERRDTP